MTLFEIPAFLDGLPRERRLDAGVVELPGFPGGPRAFARGLTFTPFASARPCSARCRFCSETLQHKESRVLSAQLRPGPDYDAHLRRALAAIRELPVGLSLSGLEATDAPDWLAVLAAALADHVDHGGRFTERVLYTNTNGLARDDHARVERSLDRLALDRAEVSRHDPDPERNQRIMRFRPDEAAGDPARFRAAVARLRALTHVRLVCVLQRHPDEAGGGVSTPDEVLRYLDFAESLGVDDVVFRELSRLGDLYLENKTSRYVDAARVPLEPLLAATLRAEPALEPERVVQGYYYWNLRARRGACRVTFETSDYAVMKARHRSGVVHKLILHADGTLGGDWDPRREVLLPPTPSELYALVPSTALRRSIR